MNLMLAEVVGECKHLILSFENHKMLGLEGDVK